QELRERIRSQVHRLRIACLRGSSDDPALQQLLQQIPDKTLAIKQLLLAEREMDEAAIYTIHSFCQRVLTVYAFEVGQPFQQQLIQDEQQLRQQAVSDFWRSTFYPLPLKLAVNIRDIWQTPSDLLKDIQPYLRDEMAELLALPLAEDDLNQWLTTTHQQFTQQITQLKTAWLEAVSAIETIISQSDVDKRSYSKKNLPKWIAEISQWAQLTTESYYYPPTLSRFSQAQLIAKTSKTNVPQHPLFMRVEQFLQQAPNLKENLLP